MEYTTKDVILLFMRHWLELMLSIARFVIDWELMLNIMDKYIEKVQLQWELLERTCMLADALISSMAPQYL